MLDDMLGYMETIRDYPVWQVIPDEVRARFRAGSSGPAHVTGGGPSGVHDLDSALCGAQCPPRFSGLGTGRRNCGGHAGGDACAAGLNANVGGRDQIPLEVENQVTEWMRTLFDFPASSERAFRHRYVDGKLARGIDRAGCAPGRRGSPSRRRIPRRS